MSDWHDRLGALPSRSLGSGLVLYEAGGFGARLRGLALLDELPEHAGLHLPRTKSVHTLGMRFALDLLWLDAAGAVVAVSRDVPRRRMRACGRARSVVEVRAGAADAWLEKIPPSAP